MRSLVVVDTETTSLDRSTRQAWDVAAVKLDPETLEEVDRMQFFADVDLDFADETALQVGHFYERSPQNKDEWFLEDDSLWSDLVDFTEGALLVGIQPSFDEHTLWRQLQLFGLEPKWYYKLIDAYDVLAGASGKIFDQLKTEELCEAVGIPPLADDVRHTALGDALLAADMLRKARELRA